MCVARAVIRVACRCRCTVARWSIYSVLCTRADFYGALLFSTSQNVIQITGRLIFSFLPVGAGERSLNLISHIVIRARAPRSENGAETEQSERGILAEPAAHLSADEESGATQVEQPHGDEGGAGRHVRIDQRADRHPPSRHRRAQGHADRDLRPRMVPADHLRRRRPVVS